MNDILASIMFFIVLFGLVVGVDSAIARHQCSEIGKALNYKTEWHYFTGCIVEKPDGNKVLLRQVRNMEK